MGNWNLETNQYDYLNYDNLNWGLEVANSILSKWGSHSAFAGYEPVNEPWG